MEGPKLLEIFNLESCVTPSTLTNFFSQKYLDTPLYHIRAPYRNERIVLPDPPPSGLIDPQKDLSIVFFVKQRDYGLTFPFTPFFIEVFQYFGITPRMLSPNSILFMCSFESICLSWGLTPTVRLFVTFFCLVSVGFLRLTSVDKKYDVEKCMFASNLRDIQDAASDVKMDQIKPPKNFTLSRESMNAALDALRAGRSVGETTQRVAEVISTRSQRAFTEGAKKAPRVTARPVEGTELVKTDVPEERFETSATKERAPEGGMEIIPAGESAQGASVEVTPVTEEGEPGPVDDAVSEGAMKGVGSKRLPPSKVLAPAPASKKSRTSKRPDPALPPLEKKKETSVVPLLSAPDNDILNVEDITHQSPASVVAKILRERIFGGVTEALDPHLLALTGLLLMGLFMKVDARDESNRSTVDRQVEEAHLEENLIATSDARGHLAAAQGHLKTLREELAHTKEALKGADKRAAAAEVHRDEVLKQLSSLEEAQKDRDEARCQHESLKADFDAVLAQKDEALARVVHLSQEVEALKKRCAALLEDAKLAEDMVQLECEKRLKEYKESVELKKEIDQACVRNTKPLTR
ncbi:uncharacterized abhydrolase domain-containing protein DDB_G0269086-like [Manihot esculenta]|uniref:uncharacterized abhydrolase domain-containing protein DDB_G0269086-like n=1 Tax=Manihot esculenta TaxID=3983 RepID=UPI000B5D71F1|nr:uncharacterized abhydrolase domain-containing protein DDB_G0269086-like [Manihot esculenta]